jgi:hypothetical protein
MSTSDKSRSGWRDRWGDRRRDRKQRSAERARHDQGADERGSAGALEARASLAFAPALLPCARRAVLPGGPSIAWLAIRLDDGYRQRVPGRM